MRTVNSTFPNWDANLCQMLEQERSKNININSLGRQLATNPLSKGYSFFLVKLPASSNQLVQPFIEAYS